MRMHLKSVRDLGCEGAQVVLRTSLNVPIERGMVANPFRLRASAETIEFLASRGAVLTVLAHLVRAGESLTPVVEALRRELPHRSVVLISGAPEELPQIRAKLSPDTIAVVENVRLYTGEESNDEALALSFSKLGDFFVNDAFADSHRTHASVVGISRHLPSYAGLLLEREVDRLSHALTPSHPALAIIGGAKFETKEPLIEKLVSHYDRVCVGGALVNDFFKQCGYYIGESLTSSKGPDEKLLNNQRIELPNDIVVASVSSARTTIPADIRTGEFVADAGPSTGRRWAAYIKDASFVVLNGPLGIYEKGFNTETERLAAALAESTAYAVVGGGDTIAALQKFSFDPERIFLSSGGGAMLEFLTAGTLVGIESLRADKN